MVKINKSDILEWTRNHSLEEASEISKIDSKILKKAAKSLNLQFKRKTKTSFLIIDDDSQEKVEDAQDSSSTIITADSIIVNPNL